MEDTEMTRRNLIAGGGVTIIAGAVGVGLMMGCGDDYDKIDPGYEGSETTITGEITNKAQDGSRISFSNEDAYTSVRMQPSQQRQINEAETGDCITVSGLVTNVDQDDGHTSARLESGRVE